ncbi:hypothetical protein ACOME3_004020 [Neoechinorhynchus agilis]
MALTDAIDKDEAKDQKLFDNVHDRKHVMADIREIYGKSIKNMTDLELDTYFFKVHDYNFDDRLDGVELMKAYLKEITPDGKRLSDEILEHSIDYVLTHADLDGDRYLDFSEFRKFTTSHRGI